jgi:3-oxoacyl-[acyl-carrier-protein] synthase II
MNMRNPVPLFPPPPKPSEPPRVVVTGAGIVTALGLGWKDNALGFRAGKTAFRPITLFDTSHHRVKTGAQVAFPLDLPSNHLTPRQSTRLERGSRMLLLAALEAWKQSGWEPGEFLPVVLGTTGGGMPLGEDYFRQAVNTPTRHRGQPTRAFHYQSQIHGRMVLDALGCDGSVMILSTACASGSSSIGHAWEMIRQGKTDRILAGGYDSLNQMVFSGFDALQTLSPTTCRPFDAHRDGLAVGEGAAIVALETLESARRRNAVILGELAGYGTSMDRHHLPQPHPEGVAAGQSMANVCEIARVAPDQIDYVNAHGTGTPLNDSAEAMAISRWAGSHARALHVSSTKAGIGHTLGGAGSIEAVISLMCLSEQWLPPELAFENPDPACAFPIVNRPQDATLNCVLSNSFGFGGVNASLIFRRFP